MIYIAMMSCDILGSCKVANRLGLYYMYGYIYIIIYILGLYCLGILYIYIMTLSQLMTCRPPPPPLHPSRPPILKSGQIGFYVQKNAQCCETCEKVIFLFLHF